MKKFLVLCCSVFFLLSCSTAFSVDHTVWKYLNENNIAPYFYEEHFADKYTPEEFVALYQHFEQYDVELQYAIGENAYMVFQDLSTYNKVDERYCIISYDGTVLYDYENNSWVDARNTDLVRIGDYVFIKTKGNPATYDIFNTNGEFIRTFNENGIVNYYPADVRLREDLGNDYYLFENDRYGDGNGSGDFYVLDPQGEFWKLVTHRNDYHVMKGYYSEIDTNEVLGWEDGYADYLLKVGKISEGKFSIWGNSSYRDIFGVYFDLQGNRLIDLSFGLTNFHVYSLGEFCDGQAEIKFYGADDRRYVGIIDVSGEFIGEPERQE